MATNKRIIQFPEAQSAEADDYILLDHVTEGTRKILASAIGGGGSAYSGATEPASSLGSNGDIYFQIVNTFAPQRVMNNIWNNVSVTKKANGKFTIIMSGTGGNANEFVTYKIENLIVGREYTFEFNAQISSSARFYNESKMYGVQFAEHADDYNPLLTGTAGEFDDTNNYMPFYEDHDSHDYECTITATAETMYLIFGFADIIDGVNNTLTIDDLECPIICIIDIWTKNSGVWVKYTSKSNSGGGGYSKTLLWDSGSTTTGATYATDYTLLDNISNYDQIILMVSTNGDRADANHQYTQQLWLDAEYILEAGSYHNVNFSGYGTRYFEASFTDSSFRIIQGGGEGGYMPTIFQIYGIKY